MKNAVQKTYDKADYSTVEIMNNQMQYVIENNTPAQLSSLAGMQITTAKKSILISVKIQSLVAKCCKMGKI